MQLTNELLHRLRLGSLTFNAFVALTIGDFNALATAMMKKRTVPPSIEREDIVQEMLIAVNAKIGEWREDGTTIKHFVVFTACSTASKYLKVSTNQKNRDDHFEIPREFIDADQDTLHDVAEAMQSLPIGERQTVILHSVMETQCVDRTTDDLMKHPNTRDLFAEDRESVRRGVYRTVRMLTHRAYAMA